MKIVLKGGRAEKLLLKLETTPVLYYDCITGTYLTARPIDIMKFEMAINQKMAEEGEADLIDWITLLESVDPSVSQKIDILCRSGWAYQCLYDHGESWIHFRHDYIEMDDGQLCFTIMPNVLPCDAFSECIHCDE